MPGLPQRSSGSDGSLTGNLWKSLPLALAGLATLSGCILFGHPRFDAEVKALKAEADQRFPPESNAAEFEAWFTGKAGTGFGAFSGVTVEPKIDHEKQCEPRYMNLNRVEGCMNVLTAHYCVDDAGKLKSLDFKDWGYC
jgi:hypothetical protein